MRFLRAFLAAVMFSGAAQAQQVTALPAANLPLSGAEILYIIQGGVSKQTPVSTLAGSGSFTSLSAQSLSVTGTSTLSTLSMTGEITTNASTTGGAGFNLPPGTAPTSPVNGDMWTTSAGVFARIAGVTVGPFGSGGGVNNSNANYIAYYATTGNQLSGLATANSSVLVTSGAAVPSFSTTLPGNLTIPSVTATIVNVATSASLPVVTGSNQGQLAWVQNCQNGSQGGGSGTGCLYAVNNAGSWQPMPLIPTTQVTIGGQAIYLGGATTNQGNGSKIATANGSFTNGDCVSINSGGAFIDSGGACGGGGGSGTVSAGTTSELAYYASNGTTVAGIATGNNGILVTSGSGVPSIATTLPTGLTLPTATISTPTITGTGTYVTLTGSGKLTTAAATTTIAGLNLPAGTAPTSPVNGDVWTTTAGLYARINGTTIGPYGTANGTVTSIATSAPLGGGTITSTGTLTCTTCALTTNGGLLTASSPATISAAGVIGCATCVTSSGGGAATATAPVTVSSAGLIACTTCATTTSGGALSATSPMAISSGGVISISPILINSAVLNWDSNTTVTANTYYLSSNWLWQSGSVASVSYATGGSGSPAFNIAVQINGVNVATCNGITVNSSSIAATICGSNTISPGQPVTLVISSVSGSPSSAVIQVAFTRSPT